LEESVDESAAQPERAKAEVIESVIRAADVVIVRLDEGWIREMGFKRRLLSLNSGDQVLLNSRQKVAISMGMNHA
jgi:hypothetical protein